MSWTKERASLVRERLAKLQREMKHQGVGACLFTNPMHVRYATGVSVMPLWTAFNLARYALVPAEGDPLLYEYSKALFVAREAWPTARPAIAWQQRFSQHEVESISKRWAEEILGQLREWGVEKEKVACDPLDVTGFEALRSVGVQLVDSDEIVDNAKLIKSPAELKWLRESCAVAEAALFEMEKAIRPGVTELELFGVFNGALLARGGEMCSTRLLVSGEKTNPWFYECGERMVRPGDLVGIDTDMTGPEGYLCDISRTFVAGEKTNDEQKEAYRVARDFIEEMIPKLRPGVGYAEVVERAPKYPTAYQEQGYSCMIHGAGFDDEPPFLPYADSKGALIPRGELREGMVLCVEFYAGKKGAREGVKLEEQVVVTAAAPERMSRYPWDDRF